MADTKSVSTQVYCLRWRNADMAEPVELQTGMSLKESLQDYDRPMVWLAIEKNVTAEMLDVDLSHLEKLELKCIESSTLVQKLLDLLAKGNLQTLTIVDGDFSTGLQKLPESLLELNMIRCRLKIEKIFSELNLLKKLHLECSDFKTDESLGHLLAATRSLTELSITDCDIKRLPQSLGNLKVLERLNMYSTHLNLENEKTLSVFNQLENLAELNLTECKLPFVPESVLQLPKLTKLILTRNKLLGQTIPDKFDGLESLRELSLSTCYLSELPSSMSKLKKLESLDLSANSLSMEGDLSPIESLTSLTCLSLSECNLDTLPKLDKLINLRKLELACNNFSTAVSQEDEVSEDASATFAILDGIPKSVSELDLSGNNFSGGLPEIVGDLPNLTCLKVSNCYLATVPESILSIKDLEVLDISKNNLTDLPENIGQMKKLKSLDLANSSRLKSIITLPKLEILDKLNVEKCGALLSPPFEVCKQGLEFIRKFCSEVDEEKQPFSILPTVVVVGKSSSRKKLLIKSLVAGKMIPVHEDEVEDDFSTIAEKVQTIKIGEKELLRVIDFGSREIFQVMFCLTLTEDSIPVIVVNMDEYKKPGYAKITKRLCFDYIAYSYLTTKRLPKPKLVLIQRDKFNSTEEFETLRSKFLEDIQDIRRSLSPAKQETDKCFSNLNEDFFEKQNIFVVGNDYEAVGELRSKLINESKSLSKQIPAKWEEASREIAKISEPMVSVDEIVKSKILKDYNPEICRKILSFSHSSGKLLWYQNVQELQNYVFPKVETVTNLLAVFFDSKQKARKEMFHEFLSDEGKWIGGKELEDSEKRFQDTGVMSKTLLIYLIKEKSQFQSDAEVQVALTILQSFQLVFGPIKQEKVESYVFPYFVKGRLEDAASHPKEFPFKIENKIWFEDLLLPQYVYHQVNVQLLQLLQNESTALPLINSDIHVKNNGVHVASDRFSILMTHDFKSIKIELCSEVKYVKQSWDLMVKMSNTTIQWVCKTWKAAEWKCEITCPHCQLTKSKTSHQDVNPKWINSDSRHNVQYVRGMKEMSCNGEPGVPAALKQPCDTLSRRELRELENYVNEKLHASRQTREEPKSLRAESEDIDGEASDVSDPEEEQHFLPKSENEPAEISVQVASTRLACIRKKFANTEEVYSMSTPTGTSIRGRTIIINNVHFGEEVLERKGSENDANNLSQLFTAMAFDVVHANNLTAEGMMSLIEQETDDPRHNSYQAFVLVIMSHGTQTGGVYGTDMKAVGIQYIVESVSASRFAGMSGKPKLIIVQACGGDKRAFGDLAVHLRPSADDIKAADLDEEARKLAGNPSGDIVVVKSSCEKYSSARHPRYGSPFIRCLVSTFAKHACHRDVVTLLEMVQCRVKLLSVQLESRDYVYPQVPVICSTLSDAKSFYLFPGYFGRQETS
ncbi:uncharacterized protein [Watersipora subatra]|uniref:uncharacterized protein n=1 Tax=Watersipora subatra TaxID=2589382 RepID=UPI00355C52D8